MKYIEVLSTRWKTFDEICTLLDRYKLKIAFNIHTTKI